MKSGLAAQFAVASLLLAQAGCLCSDEIVVFYHSAALLVFALLGNKLILNTAKETDKLSQQLHF